eukprot:6086436-Pleurochrysis_carterae.AAC.1
MQEGECTLPGRDSAHDIGVASSKQAQGRNAGSSAERLSRKCSQEATEVGQRESARQELRARKHRKLEQG